MVEPPNHDDHHNILCWRASQRESGVLTRNVNFEASSHDIPPKHANKGWRKIPVRTKGLKGNSHFARVGVACSVLLFFEFSIFDDERKTGEKRERPCWALEIFADEIRSAVLAKS